MRIFVYEYVTGGGLLADPRPPQSLLREGAAMATALATDFAALPDTQVTVLRDARCTDLAFTGCRIVPVANEATERAAFQRTAAGADRTVVIAPEFDGILRERCRLARAGSAYVLGPDDATIALTSDKHRTAEHLRAHGVPAPIGLALEAGERPPPSFVYPAVWKRRDGAGSMDVRLLRTWEEASEIEPLAVPSRLEPFVSGVACSVAWLCGSRRCYPLPPCRQYLSRDGRFAYRGGSTPLPPPLAARAVELSRRAIASLPHPRGYLGVDLVLGDDAEGRDDAAIEINPRPTTSYVGLRAISGGNLAQAMLDVADGRMPELQFSSRTIEFSADGTVRPQEPMR